MKDKCVALKSQSSKRTVAFEGFYERTLLLAAQKQTRKNPYHTTKHSQTVDQCTLCAYVDKRENEKKTERKIPLTRMTLFKDSRTLSDDFRDEPREGGSSNIGRSLNFL